MLNQRRRAVYGALQSLFGERPAVVSGCFRLWEREFATQPHFVVTRFVSRCAETVGMSDAERFALTRRAFELMAKPYEALERYPDELLQPPRDAVAAAPLAAAATPAAPQRMPTAFRATAAVPAAATVAAAVGRALLAPLRAQARSQPALLGEIVDDAARHARLPDPLRERISAWSVQAGTDDAMLADLDLESLRQWVHVLYLASCDASGPVAADRLLAQAIARAAALPAAVEFPPDQLL